MMRMSVLCALLGFGLVLTGCAGGKGDVSGRVKYKGAPCVGGTISFFDSGTGTQSCEIKEDGSYSVKGLATGPAKISVVMPMDIRMQGMPAPTVKGGEKPITIPEKYNDAKKSGLELDVKNGSQQKDFDLD